MQEVSAFSDPYVCLQPPFLHDVPIGISTVLWPSIGLQLAGLVSDFTCSTNVGDTSTVSFTCNMSKLNNVHLRYLEHQLPCKSHQLIKHGD
jgi:hypothetical protein